MGTTPTPSPEPFSQLLKSALSEKGVSQSEFSRLVKQSHTMINRALTGARAPDGDMAERWANCLDLTGQRRADFIRAATLAKAGRQSRATDGVETLMEELVEARQRVARLDLEVSKVREQMKALTIERMQLAGDLASRSAELRDLRLQTADILDKVIKHLPPKAQEGVASFRDALRGG